ncbi:MAG: phage tail protein [Roseburia sp.]|nr:phage tail protein [Roseburia sp.]
MQEKNFTIGYQRLKKAYCHGFHVSKQGTLSLSEGESHFLVLSVFNSYQKGFSWGRLHFFAELPKECIFIVRGFAWDGDEGAAEKLNRFLLEESGDMKEKRECFIRSEGVRSVNHQDILFYELFGQYLWISIEVVGEGQGTIKDMVLFNPGDNFMQTFPEVYQDFGGFFHRYMSIFSTVYSEVGQEISGMDRYLDLDRTPVYMLPTIADWLGIRIPEGFLEERVFRRFLKEAYELNKKKGTKEAVLGIVELMLGVRPAIVEGNCLSQSVRGAEREIFNRLFGCGMWDITVLAFYPGMERTREQVLYLLSQFMPARSRLRLVFYQESSTLDSYCFLDQNARLAAESFAAVDGGHQMDGSVMLA